MVNGEASTRECGAKASADEVYFGVSRLGRAFIILVIILQAIMAIGFFGMFTVIDFYRVAYMLDPVSIFMAVSEIMLVIVMLATAKYGTKRYWAIFLLSPFVSLSSPFITAILGIFGAIISALLPIGVAIFAFILIVRHDKRVRQPLFVFLFVFMIFAGIANAAFLAGVSWLSFAISFLTYSGVYIVYLVDLATQCSKFSDKSRLLAVTFAIAMMIIPTAIIYSGSFSVKSNIDSPDYRVSSGERLSIDNADPQDDIFIAFNMKYVKGDIRICYFDPSDDCNLETYRYSVQRENNAAPGIIIGNMQNHGSINGNVYVSCFAYAKDFVIKISGASSYSLVIYEEQADNNIVIGDEFQSDTFFINEIFVVEKTGYYDLTLYAPATLKILDENYPDKSAKLSDLGKSVNKVYLQSGKRYFIESEFSEIIELSAKFKGEADGLSHETAYIYDAANYSVQLKKGVPFYLRYNISSPRFSKSMAYRFDGDVNISCSVNAAASVNMPDYIIDFWGEGYEAVFIFRSEQDIVGTVNITNKQNRAAKSAYNTASVFAENSQLESPNNPRIEINAKEFGNDGYIFAAWDRVENATKYVFKLYRDNEKIFESNVADSEKPRVGLADRWSDANIAGNVGKYYFTVSASDGGVNYLNSEASDSPNFDVALTQTCGTPTNLKVENRVLSWGKVENAVAYNVSIKSGRGSGSFVTTQTQYELSDYDKNDVVISVMALGDKINFKNSEESVLEVNIPPILIDSPQNLVITKNKISWDRMLGDVESYDYTIYDNKTGIHTQTTNTRSSYAYVNLGHGEYYFTVVAVVYSNSAYENSRAAKSEVLSLIAPPISGSVRITGELTYNSSLRAEYTGEADKNNLEYVWYRDGELINAESTSAYYLLKKEDVGHIISVKVSDSRNCEGELTATTVQEVQRAKFREPFPSPRVASDNIGNMILALPADVSFGFRAEFNKIWYGVQTSGEIQWSQSSALGKIVEGETYCFYLRFEDSDCYYGGTSVGHTYSLKSQPHITNIVPQISGESITISGIDGYTVQWYVGFNKIDGATNASYAFSPKDKGKVVYARVYYGGTEVYKTAYQTVPGKINANQLNNTLPILLIILGGFAFAVTCIGVLFLLHTKFWWLK